MIGHVITGGYGFIGSRLSRLLTEENCEHDLVGYDTGMGGILDFGRLLKLFKDTSVIFHLGAISGSKFFDDMKVGTRINCEGTANVLEAARINDVKTVVFASTSSCYAFTSTPHKETNPTNPVNFYTSTKLYGEYLMKLFADLYGIRTVILRFGSVYGVGEEKKGSVQNPVTQFINAMLEGKAPILYGDGTQKRDLVFADDVAEALYFVSHMPEVKAGEIYNIAYGVPTTFNEVVHDINEVLGIYSHISPIYIPFPENKYQTKYIDIQHLDTTKINDLGWGAKVGLVEGIKRIIDSKTKK